MNFRIGIDVGGTNTDAVIINERNAVVSFYKTATTEDVSSGVEKAVKEILALSKINVKDIKNVMLGTTHATNALVERKHLAKAGVIRLAAPSGFAIPPYTAWPEELLKAVFAGYEIVRGGYEYSGVPLSNPDKDEIKYAIDSLVKKGAQSLAISCAFSPVNHEGELFAAETARELLGGAFPVTLSHETGSVGLLERENAAILNASIRELVKNAYGSFQQSIHNNGIRAELFITQNDGTLMSIEKAKQYPVLTIASGPTNSLRGAAFLSNKTDAFVVDVGGTTTDIGVLNRGFPRESGTSVEICGVRTNFRMPDIISIGLGGGSIINKNPAGIGPQSTGFRISEEALIFGGTTLTATDIAVKNAHISLGNPDAVSSLESGFARECTEIIKNMIETALDTMKTQAGDVPVILVGGGSIIVPRNLQGVAEIIIPENFGVANAIGAAIAQVSGSIDGIYNVTQKGREKVLEEIKEEAVNEAVKAGALRSSTEIVEIEEIPLAYLPSNAVRIRVKAAGSLG
ncbi:MAG: hydantoinase/oxoprolinase family protein [Treponema sp.]|jgi:N-methylhydantoinase A/oxoprolinase/acetone carboxylase beta subunit|nr:hydantoinase/oxoprolinase family protein [Treponema sp.]